MTELAKIETVKKAVKSQLNQDPLLECFAKLLTFYSIEADIKGVVDSIPYEGEYLSAEDIIAVAKRIGFKSEVKEGSFEEFKESAIPLILFCNDGSYRVQLPQKTHPGQIFKPAEGVIHIKDDDIEGSFSKKALVLYPEKMNIDVETRHMLYGHMIDWFWKPIWSYWHHYSEILLCSVFINLFVLALPLFTMNVYDRVVSNFVEPTLFVLTTGIILVLVFDFLFKLIRSYLMERVAVSVGIKYDFDLMERLLTIRPTDLQLSVGERSNIFRELQSLRDFYASKLAPTLVDVPFFLLFLWVINLISPALMLIPLAGAVIIIGMNYLVQILINRSTEKYFTSIQAKSSVMIETLAGSEAIRMFNAVGDRLFKWNLSINSASEQARRNHFLLDTTTNFSYFMTHLVHVFVLFFGAYEINEGNLTVGGLIACTILSGRSIGPIMNLSNVVARLKQSKDVLFTIDSIFKVPNDMLQATNIAPKGPFKGKLTIKNLFFQYPGQTKPALAEINLEIEPGQRVGLIGRSGAGKSTLAQIVSSALKQPAGEVLLDSYSYENISPTELSRTIGVVPQESFFFAGSLRENILLGEKLEGDEKLERAIKFSGLDIVLEQTGHGLDMEVLENGGNLSGGHKQAVALARVFIRDPKIVIFDEPTTGMDNVLEARLKITLEEFLVDRTFIMVTHRTTLLPVVDRLVLLDNGRIVADGPRAEILQKLTGRGE